MPAGSAEARLGAWMEEICGDARSSADLLGPAQDLREALDGLARGGPRDRFLEDTSAPLGRLIDLWQAGGGSLDALEEGLASLASLDTADWMERHRRRALSARDLGRAVHAMDTGGRMLVREVADRAWEGQVERHACGTLMTCLFAGAAVQQLRERLSVARGVLEATASPTGDADRAGSSGERALLGAVRDGRGLAREVRSVLKAHTRDQAPTPTPLGRILPRVLAAFEASANGDPHVELSGRCPPVRVDGPRLQLVLDSVLRAGMARTPAAGRWTVRVETGVPGRVRFRVVPQDLRAPAAGGEERGSAPPAGGDGLPGPPDGRLAQAARVLDEMGGSLEVPAPDDPSRAVTVEIPDLGAAP